jgi:membrane-associated protein
MSTLLRALEWFLHIDRHLGVLIQQLGTGSYVLLFLVIFAETGLVITPFLPGDSLLFAVGAFAARGVLELWIVLVLLIAAAIIGDSVNYTIGRRFGQWFITKTNGRLIKQEHLEKTEKFYAKYGAKTIVLARFVPIVRTLAPFVAGVGKMEYKKFLFFNVFGGILWVVLFVVAGYLFGNIPVVQHNFTFVIFAIIGVSILPGIIEYARAKWGKEGLAESAE